MKMINAFNMLQQSHQIMKKLEEIPQRIAKIYLYINKYN